jgi:hypothetical protein
MPSGVGFDEQIFGADEQVPERRRRHLRSVRPTSECRADRAEQPLIRSALTCPGHQWLGLFPSLGATNKSLARTNKSQKLAKATNKRSACLWWSNGHSGHRRDYPLALRGWPSTLRCTGDTGNEDNRLSYVNDCNLHCHFLDVHGAEASIGASYYNGRISAQWHALVQLVNHSHLQTLACGLATILSSGK